MDGEKAPGGTVARLPSVHEQEDGTILAVCATGSSSRDSLLSWVRRLEVGLQSFPFLLTQFVPLESSDWILLQRFHTHVGFILCP